MTTLPKPAQPPDGHQAAAAAAADSWQLPEPRLVRSNRASLWRADRVALRVDDVGTGRTLITAADAAIAAGCPTAPPVHPEPFVAPGERAEVTAWRWVDHTPGAPIDWRQLGETVAAVHAAEIPQVTPVACPIRALIDTNGPRVAAAAGSGELTGRQLAETWDVITRDVGHDCPAQVLSHGDVHPGNVLVHAPGLTLLDWELAGPCGWMTDHVAPVIHDSRFDVPDGSYDRFARGYGRSALEQPEFHRLVTVRETRLAISAYARALGNPQDRVLEREARVRAAWVLDRRVEGPWGVY